MRRITLWLLLCAAVGAFCCAVAYAQDSDELEDAKKNIERIEDALKELSQKKALTHEDMKLRAALEKSLKRLKELKEYVEHVKVELRKLNEQAEGILKQLSEVALKMAEDAIKNKDFVKAAELLREILEADPANAKAQKMLEDVLPSASPAPYRFRQSKKSLAGEGGTEATESAVAAALKWLRSHQDKDGKWDQDGFQKNCKGAACDGQGTSQYDVGVSGLALLAFMGCGNTHKQGKYKKTLKRGIDWLVGQQQGDGSLGPRLAESWIYNHAIGTMALCEAYGLSRDKNLKDPAKNALNFILKAQNAGLGWKYEPGSGRNDTSVTGWMVLALNAAKSAGLHVPDSVFQGARNWFDRATNTAGKCGYMRPGDDGSVIRGVNMHYAKLPTMTGVSVLCRILSGQKRQDAKILRGVDILMSNLPDWNKPKNDKVDMYYWYYATYAMFQYGGEKWDKWNKAMKKALVGTQRKGGCPDGSWDPVSKWGMVGGRVYSTAINCLTLEVYYRYARKK